MSQQRRVLFVGKTEVATCCAQLVSDGPGHLCLNRKLYAVEDCRLTIPGFLQFEDIAKRRSVVLCVHLPHHLWTFSKRLAWADVYFRIKWRLHPSSHLATIDMGRKLGRGSAPFLER